MEEKHGDNNNEKSLNGNEAEEPLTDDNACGKPYRDTDTGNRHTIHHEPINIIIEPNEKEDTNAIKANSIAKRANRIGWTSAIANFILIGFTFYLWQEAHNQNKTANDALKLSREQ